MLEKFKLRKKLRSVRKVREDFERVRGINSVGSVLLNQRFEIDRTTFSCSLQRVSAL